MKPAPPVTRQGTPWNAPPCKDVQSVNVAAVFDSLIRAFYADRIGMAATVSTNIWRSRTLCRVRRLVFTDFNQEIPMQDWSDVTRMPDGFDGRVRLFPLPELVLFPHAMQPLHIFEPRYCEMLHEALSSDQLIAMATLDSNDDALMSFQAGRQPDIEPTICMGRIVSHTALEDDRHNVLLVGIRRAKIVNEIDAGRSFRIADVEVLDDVYPPASASTRDDLKQQLLESFASIIPPSTNAKKGLNDLMSGQMGLGPITDIVSYTLPFDVPDKMRLLGEANVDVRAQRLIDMLDTGTIQLHSLSVEEQSGEELLSTEDPSKDGEDRFPPPFSLN